MYSRRHRSRKTRAADVPPSAGRAVRPQQVRDIFTAARAAVIRSDELQDQQREQSARLSESRRARDAGTSRRAATEPSSESPSTPPGQERTPHGGVQRQGKQQERAGKDSTTGRGSQDERPRAAAPMLGPAAGSVTEADRVRLAVHDVAAKLPRTEPYAGSSHRPPAFSNERFNRLAVATDDEFVRKVIAGVQKEQTYYTDFERTESEKNHLRPAVDGKHQEALARYEAAEAERGIFRRRKPKPTRAEAEVAAIQEVRVQTAWRHRGGLPRGTAKGACGCPTQTRALRAGAAGDHPSTRPVADAHHETAGSRRLRTKPVGVR